MFHNDQYFMFSYSLLKIGYNKSILRVKSNFVDKHNRIWDSTTTAPNSELSQIFQDVCSPEAPSTVGSAKPVKLGLSQRAFLSVFVFS